jgi:hypothetical protein
MINHTSLGELFRYMGGIVTPKNVENFQPIFSKVLLILPILPDQGALVIIDIYG